MSLVRANQLRQYKTRSCGCFLTENLSLRRRTHGKRRSAEYRIWAHMKERCQTPSSASYASYGGRGILLDWETFEQFFADMGPRPTPQHSIERLDNNGPYAAWNCVWATAKTQARNRRNSLRVVWHGQTWLLTELAEHLHLKYHTLYMRMKRCTPFDAKKRLSKRI